MEDLFSLEISKKTITNLENGAAQPACIPSTGVNCWPTPPGDPYHTSDPRICTLRTMYCAVGEHKKQ